ncbi:hypothetical protein A2379_00990 [Candidatus Amesbacteria bacterium RIFOXYB1_FULL_47_13]|nr:MAG: hypothetical protein A2379_00990 [Candidatus Amesbacteria bacterium RIFOXYB1_FULL_47_13]HBC73035.1 hypothetical protein [Candidatus Amesbacteria bacterium]
MQQKIIRTGNSIAVTIPAEFAKNLGLKSGGSVRVKTDSSRGTLTLIFHGTGQLTLLPKTPSPR